MTGLVFSLFIIATLFLIGQYALMSIVMTTWWAKGKYLKSEQKKKQRWRGGMKFRWDEYEDKDNGQYIYTYARDDDVHCLYGCRWGVCFSMGSKIRLNTHHSDWKIHH